MASRAFFRWSWLGWLMALFFGIFFLLPVVLLLLFRFVPVPFTPLMINTWIQQGSIQTNWVPIENISSGLVRAAIGAEDNNFCTHAGFDWKAIQKAQDHNARGRTLRGASTISQQTAKNLFLLPTRSWVRKGAEAYLTVLMEALWPKRRIIEAYLNIAQFGPDIFGAEAAARAYYHKHAANLTSLESARIASVLPNPVEWHVVSPGPYVASRTQTLMGRISQVRRDGLDRCIYP
jgi:monofunctional biosynthetic peptidoglycan transglycosylase